MTADDRDYRDLQDRDSRWARAGINPYRSLRHLILYARAAREDGRRGRAADLLGEIARKRRDTQAAGDFQDRRTIRRHR
jgi:hypothetical protein